MRRRKRNAKNRLTDYNSLEPRHLLASVIGGAGNDVVKVDYVDSKTVEVNINDTVKRYSISDGLHINLKGGQGDQVFIDHRIIGSIQIFNTESITLDGGDNHWQIGSFADPSAPASSIVAGMVNKNIRFAGVNAIQSGAGTDVFTVNTNREYSLTLRAGKGNDLFRFFRSLPLESSSGSAPLHVAAYGEAGNDRFVFRGESIDQAFGGTGFDTSDYQQMYNGVSIDLNHVLSDAYGIDRIIGKFAVDNSVTSEFLGKGIGSLDWIVDGQNATVAELGGGAKVELVNFNSFTGDPTNIRYDRLYVLATGDDIRINNFEWVQIGSTVNRQTATLDTINHDISLFATSSTVAAGSLITFSDQAGDGVNARFGNDGAIHGLTGGDVRFSDHQLPADTDPKTLPDILVYGSETNSDNFVFDRVWTSTAVHSFGGNDVFMVGSSNRDANGTIRDINAGLTVYGGDGDDRIYLNDQGNDSDSTSYHLSDNLIATHSVDPNFRIQISFHDLEVARVNGSATMKNRFFVTPSETTKFTVDGSLQNVLADTLTIHGQEDVRQLANNAGTGSWGFNGLRQRVFFYGVEEPDTNDIGNTIPVEKMAAIPIPNRSNAYADIENLVVTSQAELETLIERIGNTGPFIHSTPITDQLNSLIIDFDVMNVVLFTQTETSGSIRLTFTDPVFDGENALVEFDRFVPELGTTDMAYYAFAYQVDKSIPKITFTDGENSTEIINA